MEYHATGPEGAFHICTVHRCGRDESPVQIISAQKLAYYQNVEASYISLCLELKELLAETSVSKQ